MSIFTDRNKQDHKDLEVKEDFFELAKMEEQNIIKKTSSTKSGLAKDKKEKPPNLQMSGLSRNDGRQINLEVHAPEVYDDLEMGSQLKSDDHIPDEDEKIKKKPKKHK